MSFSLELVTLVVLLLNSPSAFRVIYKEIEHNLKQLTIPEKFYARENWPECRSMSEVSYRGKCDAWPFTAVAVLTDRLCVSAKGKFNNKSLSVQDLIECCKECTNRNKYGYQNKCGIGIKSMAYLHLAEEGTVSESCKSLSQRAVVSTGVILSSCRSECSNTSYDVPYAKDKKYCGQPIKSGSKAVRDPRHIQAEIMLNGPVEAYLIGRGMLVSNPSPNDSTIYKEDSKKETGPKTVYSIRIVGWGEKEGIPVWIFGVLSAIIILVSILNPYSVSGIRSAIVFKDIEHNLEGLKIPEEFDAREKWPECGSIDKVFTRGSCADWPFTAISVLTDRLCISTEGKLNKIRLSLQDLIECCEKCSGFVDGRGKISNNKCGLGVMHRAYLYLAENGTVTKACKSDTLGLAIGLVTLDCRFNCSNSFYDIPYAKDKKYCGQPIRSGSKAVQDPRHIQAEIMLNGPVESYLMGRGMLASRDNPDSSTIYIETTKGEPGIQTVTTVRIVGWGLKDGIPYWIFASTFGRWYGVGGFSLIRRGKDDFQVESNVAACMTRDGSKETNLMTTTETVFRASSEKASLGNCIIFIFALVHVLKI